MDTTCCPHYTIKQEALKFRLSKSHKKVLKLVNRFLIHGKKKGEEQAVGRDGGEGLDKGGGGAKEETAVNQVSQDTKEEMEGEQSKKTPKPGILKHLSQFFSMYCKTTVIPYKNLCEVFEELITSQFPLFTYSLYDTF